MSPDAYFRHVSHDGLQIRLARLYPKPAEREMQQTRYVERLEFEMGTIEKMGFPGYFLIVGDFINWAKNNGCPVGPGRGSGAGSLVAYALGITDLDPLQYNLLFERFLNPERVSMPDFDIDFCQANRDRVIDYVKLKYGKEAVSQIATFGTMAARAAIRDVGRVLDMSYTFCDGISKLIPNKPGTHITIDGAIKAEPILAERLEKEEDVKTLLAMAQKLEGMTRNVGTHAGQTHRLLPAVPATWQRFGREPVRQGRRRGGRSGEIRLSGAGHAHHPGDCQGAHPRPPQRSGGFRLREPATGRCQGLQAVFRRPDRSRVPV
jgi:DNA polymerase-3 subunit alpha